MLELTKSLRQIEFKKDNYGFLVSRRGTFAIQKNPTKNSHHQCNVCPLEVQINKKINQRVGYRLYTSI